MTASNGSKQYQVKRVDSAIQIDADWNKAVWADVPAQELEFYMGSKPAHRPRTQFKAAYDDENLYVIFRVEDRYVRAAAQGHQSQVCRDSCVEFFFTPGENISEGYFNLETNCGGTILLYHQTSRNQNRREVEPADLDRIEIAHSLPGRIEEEIPEPTMWTLEYRLPLEILLKYARVMQPGPQVCWRANFYKCADQTSHPHWLTWSVVDLPAPDFHRPEFFGHLVFE